MAAQLRTWLDAFPDSLPPPPINLPEWAAFDYNQFANYYQKCDLGIFTIPLVNTSLHQYQRPSDCEWLQILAGKLLEGIQANAFEGVGILNTRELLQHMDGKPNKIQMLISILSGGHCAAATLGLNIPDVQMVCVFRVYEFSASL
jgi:hypothetical protein